MKILIVDDNKQNLLLLEAMLNGGRHAVVSAGNGIEALEKLGREKFDLIISDILMPGMDGFKLCVKCKEDEKLRAIPFIFTTSSYTEAKDEEFGKSLGAEAFLVRPIEPDEFLKKIDEISGKKKEIKEAAPVELRQKDAGFLEKYSERLASQLEHKIVDLEKEVTERKRAENALQERVKELKCIADISRLAEQPGISIDEFAEKAVNLLPAGWQYPEICGARITMDSKEFKTANFRETEWCQSADIKVDGKKFGAVTVCYLAEKPAADEGAFLKEERELIDTIADFMGHVIQHRLTEKEIKRSEEKFRAIFDNATDGILLADLESKKFFTGNKNICAMLGYGLEELKGLGVMEIHPKEQLPYVVDQFEKQSRKEITLARDIPVKRKDGSVFYADVNSSPVTLEDKQYLLGIFRDITERKQAEDELKKKLAELEIFYKSAMDREDRILELKKKVEELEKTKDNRP
jgi:PAS domain S-box-containing protein